MHATGSGDAEEYAHLHSNTSTAGHQLVGETVHVCITTSDETLGGSIALINSIISNTHSPVKFHLVTTAKAADHLRYYRGSWSACSEDRGD